MKITYLIIGDGGKKIGDITGTEIRARFGVGTDDPIFTEQLVTKFNLIKECAGKPERIQQLTEFGPNTGDVYR